MVVIFDLMSLQVMEAQQDLVTHSDGIAMRGTGCILLPVFLLDLYPGPATNVIDPIDVALYHVSRWSGCLSRTTEVNV